MAVAQTGGPASWKAKRIQQILEDPLPSKKMKVNTNDDIVDGKEVFAEQTKSGTPPPGTPPPGTPPPGTPPPDGDGTAQTFLHFPYRECQDSSAVPRTPPHLLGNNLWLMKSTFAGSTLEPLDAKPLQHMVGRWARDRWHHSFITQQEHDEKVHSFLRYMPEDLQKVCRHGEVGKSTDVICI